MNIRLSTYDIQKLLMCVMFSDVSSMEEGERDKFVEKLVELNTMCDKRNNYELRISISVEKGE